MTVAIALILVCLVARFSASLAAGGSLARCFTDEHCAPQLQCVGTTDPISLSPCTDQEPYCLCLPRNDLPRLICDQSQDTCAEGEICTQIPISLIEQIQSVFPLPQLQLCIDSSQSKFVQNLSTCQDDSQCADQGECVSVAATSICASSLRADEDGEQLSQPTPLTDPESSVEPLAPEEPNPIQSPFVPDQTEQTEQPDDAVCIAAKYLRHMRQEQLLYKSHFLANVLCDTQGSCATPGHMVLYKHRPMMMSSYCSQVTCHSELMHVNSPRYQHKLRIPSATEHLSFLAFSARHGTRAEEILLRTAIRVGL